MKKLLLLCLALVTISCSKTEENTPAPQAKADIDISEKVYSFDLNTLTPGCEENSEMVCTINASIKCTINPQFSDCEAVKDQIPNFIFMDDESLQRPTSQSYKITKIKPLSNGSFEVYTQSTCNGNWFGLCNGNIIYILANENDKWILKEIYAIES